MSILIANSIYKQFPGVKALDNVSCNFESGKVNALVGKNGSGKSTLVKIINGAQIADSGILTLDGESLHFANPAEAFAKGIATVYQEMSLVPGLSVAENILIGRYKTKGPFVDWKSTFSFAQNLLKEMEIDLPLRDPVFKLNVWQCQIVEIIKAISYKPKVLLLDEPTSALAQQETQFLFKLIRRLKSQNVIIIYITHRLQELWEIADTCTVLRDGQLAGKVDISETDQSRILNLMFGDVEIKQRPGDLKAQEETILEVSSLTCAPKFKDISFSVKRGEVLGIAGMLGSGRTELLRTIFGADKADSGCIYIDGKKINNPSPRRMKKHGIAFAPEDRKTQGLVQCLAIKSNLVHASLDQLSKQGFMNAEQETHFANRQIDALQIKISGSYLPMTSLSGGNQQKVVVGKWLNANPKVIILDEPSRGIDVNAKQQIFKIIWEQSRQGIASIVVSSELEELLEICHRIIIMRLGRMVAEVKPETLTIEKLYSLCMGGAA